MPPQNQAAWLPRAKAQLKVGPAPYTAPGPNELVVRARAVGLNFLEWAKQDMGDMMYSWVKYPFVLGSDVAGEVVEVGSSLTSAFQPGDRVLGMALGMDPRSARASEGAFQEHVVLRGNVVSRIPDGMPFERACVLPLCLSTAATGLFLDKHLGLDRPSPPDRHSAADDDDHGMRKIETTGSGAIPTGPGGGGGRRVLVVWGASTAVGANAVQLGAAAGYTVVATAGRHNFAYVRGLGAAEVFDYRSRTCVRDVIGAVERLARATTTSSSGSEDGERRIEGDCVGAVAVGAYSVQPCIDIVAACSRVEAGRRVAQMALNGPDAPKAGAGPAAIAAWLGRAAWAWLTTLVRKTRKGVRVRFVWGSDLVDGELARAVFADFLPAALETGSYVPAPDPEIVGHGLDQIQKGFEMGRRGVSAKKLVVTL